ncbi:MAG: hypothetical protein MI757_17950 [Pirellulales bacterium]|nr:hypothetical protein [Pirellulales bacterium]
MLERLTPLVPLPLRIEELLEGDRDDVIDRGGVLDRVAELPTDRLAALGLREIEDRPLCDRLLVDEPLEIPLRETPGDRDGTENDRLDPLEDVGPRVLKERLLDELRDGEKLREIPLRLLDDLEPDENDRLELGPRDELPKLREDELRLGLKLRLLELRPLKLRLPEERLPLKLLPPLRPPLLRLPPRPRCTR